MAIPGTIELNEQGTPPSVPPAGYLQIYALTGDTLWIQSNGGVQTQLGANPTPIQTFDQTTSGSYTINNGVTTMMGMGAGSGGNTIALTTPAIPYDGQIIGFISNNASVSAYTLTPNTGQLLDTNLGTPWNIPVNFGACPRIVYQLSTTTWFLVANA